MNYTAHFSVTGPQKELDALHSCGESRRLADLLVNWQANLDGGWYDFYKNHYFERDAWANFQRTGNAIEFIMETPYPFNIEAIRAMLHTYWKGLEFLFRVVASGCEGKTAVVTNDVEGKRFPEKFCVLRENCKSYRESYFMELDDALREVGSALGVEITELGHDVDEINELIQKNARDDKRCELVEIVRASEDMLGLL